MNLKSLFGAAAVALVTSSPGSAAPINLDFSFDGVSGTIYGLDDAVTGIQAATSYDFVGILDSYTGISAASASVNLFTFSTGTLLFGSFEDSPRRAGDDGSTSASLDYFFFQGDPGFQNLGLAAEARPGQPNAVASSTAATFTITPVTAVPLPAGGLLLLTGFAGIAALKRRKKRTV